MTPRPFRLQRRWRDTHDTVTLALYPLDGHDFSFAPGQFNMLYAFGIGEVPISISNDCQPGDPVQHTVRDMGTVTKALCRARIGDVIGVRGPFGNDWGLASAEGADLVLLAGGLGLAPLWPAVQYAVAHRDRFGRFVLLIGARSPDEILHLRELEPLRARRDCEVEITVDRAATTWKGAVGVVTELVPPAEFDPANTVAMVCGPEVMMRFGARAMIERGVAPSRIRVSLERSMKCAVAWCGHCQLGPNFVCKDGPVFSYDQVADLLAVRER